MTTQRTVLQNAAVSIAMAVLAACREPTSLPDLNNVSAETLNGGLNRSSAQLLLSGLLNLDRGSASAQYIFVPGTMARDVYRIEPGDSRWLSAFLGAAPPDPSNLGGILFSGPFIEIRAANTLLEALPSASGLTPGDKRGLSGIARTIKALAYYRALEMRDTNMIPLDVNRPIDAPPPDFVCKPNVLAYIVALLDSARTELDSAGPSFAVSLPSGFALANTPGGFAKFNRALRAKVSIYQGLDHDRRVTGAFGAAIAALDQSFLQTTDLSPAGLDLGVYHNFSTATGDFPNDLVDGTLHLNPGVSDSLQPGDRRGAKIVNQGRTFRLGAIETQYDYIFSVGAQNLSRPRPILRNEELILLRAQAKIELGDLPSATNDLNRVRMNAGGLSPYPLFTTVTAARSALLYEKRYSLLMEGPQRLVDLRAYGLLTAAYHREELPGDIFTSALPIPKAEVDARGGVVNRSCQ